MDRCVTPVHLIGTGKIGLGVLRWLKASRRYDLGQIITRDIDAIRAAPLAIDTAGPEALRARGEVLLSHGDLWTVGAAALIDTALRHRLEETARAHGTELRLFTGWIAGPLLCPPGTSARLHITQAAPLLGPAAGLLFEGPLAEAAARFPDHLNTATAAALAGPGIEATSITLHSSPPRGPHYLRARFEMPGQVIDTEVRFGGRPHPVTQAIIAALEARGRWLRYG